MLDGDGRGLTAVGCAKLGQEIGDVRASGARADEESFGDLGVRQALGQQTEDFPFTPRQAFAGGCCSSRAMPSTPGT